MRRCLRLIKTQAKEPERRALALDSPVALTLIQEQEKITQKYKYINPPMAVGIDPAQHLHIVIFQIESGVASTPRTYSVGAMTNAPLPTLRIPLTFILQESTGL